MGSHYENQAQTLTADAEANLLKLLELRGKLLDENAVRWDEIKSTFQRNLLLGGAGDDKFAQIVGQMMDFRAGLNEIRDVLVEGLEQRQSAMTSEPTDGENDPVQLLTEHVATLNQGFETIHRSLVASVDKLATAKSEPQQVQFVYRVPKVLMDVIRGQFAVMQGWVEPIMRLTEQSNSESSALRDSMQRAVANYEKLIEDFDGSRNESSRNGSS